MFAVCTSKKYARIIDISVHFRKTFIMLEFGAILLAKIDKTVVVNVILCVFLYGKLEMAVE
jgi:hypothetical protein